MAAEAHAAGSKPDPVPLASERAPSARPPSLPSLARPLLSLTPSAPALLQLLLLPLPPPPAVGRPVLSAFLLPSLHLLPQLPHSRPRPLRHEWPPFSSLALCLTPSLASSLGPSPVPAESLFVRVCMCACVCVCDVHEMWLKTTCGTRFSHSPWVAGTELRFEAISPWQPASPDSELAFY